MILKWSNVWKGLFLLLVAVALWLRTTSLETMPDVDGDESWHAVQLTRMLQGESYTLVTETGLPLSPIHAAMELPLLLVFGPSTATLRVPTVFTGILAMVLAYVLGSRILDRTTGLIASGLIAVLPVMTYCARTGYESSHAPLFTLLLVYFAFTTNVFGVSIMLMCSYFVHPTNIFLLPLLLAVMAVRSIRKSTVEGIRWRRLVAGAIPPTAIVVAMGLWTIQRPIIHKMSTVYASGIHGRHDLREFLAYFGRLFLGLGIGYWPRADALFWTVFTTVLVLGSVRLIRGKQWDRVALVGGVLASMAALFVMGSSKIIQPGMIRYGYFLVVPTILAFACLLRALLVTPSGGWSTLARSGQVAVLLALGGVLLMVNRLDLVDQARVVNSFDGRGEESPWTFGTDRQDPRKQAFSHILEDMGRRGTDRGMIISLEPISKSYFKFLALSHPGIEVVGYADLGYEPWRRAQLEGAYTINPAMLAGAGFTEWSFLANWTERWEIPSRDGRRKTSVTHLAWEFPVSGDFDNDGRVDPAYFRRSDAHWIASLSGGGTMDVAFGSHDMHEFPVPGDYDGDHKLDLAVFRPFTDEWKIKPAHGPELTFKFGNAAACEIPIPRDYDGDGRTDLGVFLPSESAFALRSSSGKPVRFQQFGLPERADPALGDFDGDGEVDLGVFIHDRSVFGYLPSRGGREVFQPLGLPGQSAPAVGDYDGDGRTDFAVYIPGSSTVCYRPSKGGRDVIQPFGRGSESLVAPGDYDGDGKTDLSVYIPGMALSGYRPSKGGYDVLQAWASVGKADIAASRPSTRK
jgi:FG-GAP repeat